MGPIGSTVFTCIGYKQTNIQAKICIEKRVKYRKIFSFSNNEFPRLKIETWSVSSEKI